MSVNQFNFVEHLRPGVTEADIAGLLPLLNAHRVLAAFVALFRGNDEDILIRLLVLREIGVRGEQPSWTPQQLQQHFAYLEQAKFTSVIQRLREHALLVWDAEQGAYQVSEIGRMALSAVSALIRFEPEAGGDLGYIIGQVAASHSVAGVGAEELQHLLSRLTELQQEFDRAVLSGSEFRIRQAEQKLGAVWQWVEKGTELIREIAGTPELEGEAHAVAQRIGRAQSRMVRMTSVFQRTLNQLESQRIHLGQTGLSSSDVLAWLRTRSSQQLASLAADSIGVIPQHCFVLGDIAIDVAEHELLERVHETAIESVLPPETQAPIADGTGSIQDDLTLLNDWVATLLAVEQPTELAECVPTIDFATASYRLSLLALLGDAESAALKGPVADLARTPIMLRLTGAETPVNKNGIASISEGQLVPLRHMLSTALAAAGLAADGG